VIRGDQDTSVFQGQGGQVRIRHEVCRRLTAGEHLAEHSPVTIRRSDDPDSCASHQLRAAS